MEAGSVGSKARGMGEGKQGAVGAIAAGERRPHIHGHTHTHTGRESSASLPSWHATPLLLMAAASESDATTGKIPEISAGETLANPSPHFVTLRDYITFPGSGGIEIIDIARLRAGHWGGPGRTS